MSLLKTKTFENIKSLFAEGVRYTSTDFQQFVEFQKEWIEVSTGEYEYNDNAPFNAFQEQTLNHRLKKKQHIQERLEEIFKITNETYKAVMESQEPQTALSYLQELLAYFESEAGRPIISGGFIQRTDGTISLRNVARDIRFDRLVEKIILPTIRKGISQLEKLVASGCYTSVGTESKEFVQAQTEDTKLTHAQIAILYHLEGRTINKNNADDIARRYGQTSGQKLQEYYDDLSSELTRTAKGKKTVENYRKIESLISEMSKLKYNRELQQALINNKK
ncbi:hypothetical protein F5984_09710 [Rudanella paleaurantiibacter]|uniref:Uncharacterized protein n=1 Tax=Rudanella paleaurantiibacter TaxID=2614655 RepID=A0A7J5U010_9BACT|nr:hypothetical protein [Rudanella paleaurantiibacter]KAB7731082.1 hypothetical protein F5984_09710 [Rudanella paleaurantiibacter]